MQTAFHIRYRLNNVRTGLITAQNWWIKYNVELRFIVSINLYQFDHLSKFVCFHPLLVLLTDRSDFFIEKTTVCFFLLLLHSWFQLIFVVFSWTGYWSCLKRYSSLLNFGLVIFDNIYTPWNITIIFDIVLLLYWIHIAIYIFSYTKILEVNLFAFAYRLFHRDFSPINGTFCIGTHSFSSFMYILY